MYRRYLVLLFYSKATFSLLPMYGILDYVIKSFSGLVFTPHRMLSLLSFLFLYSSRLFLSALPLSLSLLCLLSFPFYMDGDMKILLLYLIQIFHPPPSFPFIHSLTHSSFHFFPKWTHAQSHPHKYKHTSYAY